jgi:TfoX/Sxy family transcriptional regulator of competence genes
MEWEKVSEELSEFLSKKVAVFQCEKKKMFGCPTYFVNNNMFTGVFGKRIFLRLSEQDRTEIFSDFEDAGIFEPMKGRIMKEYIALPEKIMNDEKKFEKWLEKSYNFVFSLPPKKK